MRAIGVGCFWFERKIEGDYNAKAFCTEIENFLNSIQNINNVRISGGETIRSPLDWPWDDDDYDGDYSVDPLPVDLEIHFDIFIPKRIQNNSWEIRGEGENNIERFSVDIHYNNYLPVAYVSCESDILEYKPSKIVKVIREILEKASDSVESQVSFHSIGPSPFHMDFYFLPSEKPAEEEFVFEFMPSLGNGYDRFKIYYSILQVDDEIEAFNIFCMLYVGVIGSFYEAILLSYKHMRLTSELDDTFLELKVSVSRRGFWSFFWEYSNSSRLITDATIKIFDIEMNKISAHRFIERAKRENFIDKFPPFYRKIEEEMDDWFGYPMEEIKGILKLLEDRRLKFAENASVLIGALLGGIIGAAATVLIALRSGVG